MVVIPSVQPINTGKSDIFETGKGWATKAFEEAILTQETNGNEYNKTCQIPLLTEKKKKRTLERNCQKKMYNSFLNTKCITWMKIQQIFIKL